MMRVLSILLVFALLACSPAFAQKQGQVNDDEIYDQVRRRLANDPEVKGGTLEVTVAQGVVTIRGKVEKEKLRQKAEKLARKVKGVKQVVNELRVEKR